MPRKDWRETAQRAVALVHGEWYRSPLWERDHCLGRNRDLIDDGLAWCGRPLQVAMDGWGDPKLEGLWVTNRRAAHCAECNRKEKEWKALQPTPSSYRQF